MFHSVKRFWNEPLSQKILDGLRRLWILQNHVSPKNNTIERLVIRIGNPKALMTLITNQKLTHPSSQMFNGTNRDQLHPSINER